MNIGIDAGCLGVRDKRLKVGVYNLAKNLLIELGKLDHENKYFLYSFRPIDESLLSQLPPNMQSVIVKPTKGWMQIWLPIRMMRDRIDLFIALGQAVPVKLSSRVVTLGYIYDIAFEKWPEFYPDSFINLHLNTKTLAKKADHIVTISEISKKDIVARYKLPPSRVTSIPLGVRDITNISKKRLSNKEYFLYVGALKRIKNVPSIIKAFDLFLQTTSKEYELVFVGGDKWFDPEIKETLQNVSDNTAERIIFQGHVDDSELGGLYKNALAFVSPSFYEGFGLPHLESMSLGCPVIGSKTGSLPEIIGDSGILVDPQNIEEISQAMQQVATDGDLRDALSKKATKKAQEYSWQKCATQTLSLINSYE
jgi:glycosyltransferase involved in cell wall biosynthesis